MSETASGDASGEEDAVIEEELALLSSRHQPFCHLSSSSSNMAAVTEVGQVDSNSSTTSTTPRPCSQGEAEVKTECKKELDEEEHKKLNEQLAELSEEHDAFQMEPGQPRSLGALQSLSSFHRPIPVHVHCHCYQQGDPSTSKSISSGILACGTHKCNSPTLFHGVSQHHASSLISHPRLQAVLSNPSSTPSSSGASSPASGLQPSSLPPQLNIPPHSHAPQHYHLNSPISGSNCSSPLLIPGSSSDEAPTAQNVGLQAPDSRKMSRSISDSRIRRKNLHLNLNQSVLPSFTSLQQFKVL